MPEREDAARLSQVKTGRLLRVIVFALAAVPAFGQGCISAARQGVAMLDALCERSDGHSARRRYPWEVTLDYRYLPSHRHFVGTVEQVQRAILGNEIVNKVHGFNLTASYDINPRWTVTASLPVLKMYRDQLYVPRMETSFVSQGDATVGARVWLWRPPTESMGNIGIGFAAKLPTGKYRVTSPATDRAGNPIVATVDQSIQPGDGGTGFLINLSAFHPTPLRTMVYFQGLYVFSPRSANGVSTFRTRPGEEVFSVTDFYLYRGGISRPVPKVRGLSMSFGGRIEGVPVRDAIGKSDGFRRPGYAISADPGLMYVRGAYMFSVNVPWAVERNRKRSVSDYRNRIHGDAAFADYSLLIGVSRRF